VRQYKESIRDLKAVCCPAAAVCCPASICSIVEHDVIANGPVSFGGDAVLEEKGITVFADILTNAGGVAVSYFKWVQNRTDLYRTLDEVNGRLRSRVESCGRSCGRQGHQGLL
jgi:glutamate dehydrogenase/leucine dehydrogenase